jgi:hypothetical protein
VDIVNYETNDDERDEGQDTCRNDKGHPTFFFANTANSTSPKGGCMGEKKAANQDSENPAHSHILKINQSVKNWPNHNDEVPIDAQGLKVICRQLALNELSKVETNDKHRTKHV